MELKVIFIGFLKLKYEVLRKWLCEVGFWVRFVDF